MRKLLKGILVLFGLLAILSSIAATNVENAATISSQIAAVLIVVAPFVLPLIGKFIPLDGKKMEATMYLLSLVVAGVAAYLAGLFVGLDTMPGILLFGTALFGLMKLVYSAFNQSGEFVKYVK